MSAAVARRIGASFGSSGLVLIVVPAAIAFAVFLALSASLHHLLHSAQPAARTVVDPAPVKTALPRSPQPVIAVTQRWTGRLDVPSRNAVAAKTTSDGDPTPPGLVLPSGALAAARARLQSLATRVPATPADRPVVAERETPKSDADRANDAQIAVAPKAAVLPQGPAVYDRSTAVYEITSHTVYLPDGTRLEAHSGLGPKRDDPTSVAERMRGVTPPNVYEIQPLDKLFHGVRALRLNPVGDGNMYGRDGMLAHTYMLGPRGESNGCVVFKDYNAFLKAWDSGAIKKLAVVVRLG